MEFAGAGLILYEKRDTIPVVMEMVTVETGVQGVGVNPDQSVHSENSFTESDWVWVEEAWHPQLILPNSFDLLSDKSFPMHDSQVSCACVKLIL